MKRSFYFLISRIWPEDIFKSLESLLENDFFLDFKWYDFLKKTNKRVFKKIFWAMKCFLKQFVIRKLLKIVPAILPLYYIREYSN